MPPLAAQPLAHCSRMRTRSRVGFGSRSKFPKPKYVLPKPASRSIRLDTGEAHAACAMRNGRPKTPTASGDTRVGSTPADVAPVQVRHNLCSSQNPLTLLRKVICQVRRALASSNSRSEYTIRLLSGTYSHCAGLPALAL